MHKRFQSRPLSWSQISSFSYSAEDWYNNYILGHRSPPNSLMLAGSRIGDAIGTDNSPVPDLQPEGEKEYSVGVEIDGIKLIGHLDHYCPDKLILNENKCSDKKGRWTQGKADKHQQIDMYLLLLMHKDGIRPEDVDCWLNFVLLQQVGVDYTVSEPPVVKRFKTNRTTNQVNDFLEQVKRTVELMHQYTETKRVQQLSTPRPPAFAGV